MPERPQLNGGNLCAEESLRWLDVGHRHLTVLVRCHELDLGADRGFVQKGLVLDHEHHGHGWHVEIFNFLVPQRYLARCGIDPPDFDLPNNGTLWGVWMTRCLVNEQLDTDQEEIEGLLDDENAICLLSPSGLRDMGAREGQHFTTTTTRVVRPSPWPQAKPANWW